MNEHLKKLKKKVHDSIVEPGRGVIVGSGILGVDLILQRGVNFGSAHEFSGFSKAGKSYVMQKISAMAQRVLPDCYVVFYDRENAYDITRVLSVGLDANRTIIVPSRFIPEPDHLFEQMRLNTDEIEKAHRAHLENPDKDPDAEEDETLTKKEEKKSTLYCRSYDKKKSPHIIHVIDSIPSFSEQDKIVEDQGRRAKKWHSVMRRITGFLDPKILVLFSNHYIYKPGMYGGSIQKSSGTALDLYRDSGLKLMYQGDVQDKNGMTVGSIIGAEVDKTRRGPAAAYTFFPLYFKDGAPQFSGILPYMEYLGLAEVTNKTAVASSKTFLWPRYRVTGFSKVISEEDSDELEDFVRKNNVLGLIAKRERETIVGC
jgi:RecA/RadA recombinase